MQIETNYLDSVYNIKLYSKNVKKICKYLKPFYLSKKFEAIAFTGTSGAALAYPISAELKIPLICVRKSDKNHSGLQIEGCTSVAKYIIIDDFIDTGATINRIINKIKKIMPNSKCIAVVLYDSESTLTYKNESYFKPKFGNKIPIITSNNDIRKYMK